MKIYCPEKRVVYAEHFGNLFVYRHEEDDTKCFHLNRFTVTPTDVLKQYIAGNRFSCNEASIAALRSCDEVRSQLCEDLQNATDEEQAEKLRKIFDFCSQMEDFLLCEQLHLELGYNFIINMNLVTGRPYIDGDYPALDGPTPFHLRKLGKEHAPSTHTLEINKKFLEEQERLSTEMFHSIVASKKKRK